MRWQYKTTKIPSENFQTGNFKLSEQNEIDKFINEFGAGGWELVSTVGLVTYDMGASYTKEVILFFKRPRAEN